MAWDDDARCQFGIQFAADTIVILKEMLDPRNFMELDCRVIKHPGACLYCVENNDCNKLPIHAQCRCRPDHFLAMLDRGE